MANKPRIRFKGFTEDWEQRKLNDFGIATGGTSLESEFVDGGNYKVISIGSYSEESVYNDQGLRVNKSDKTKSRILNKNDLTMILNDKTASGNIIGRVLLIDQDNTYVYNQRTERIEVDRKNFLPIFLYHMLNAPEQRKYIVKASQGNTQIYVNWSAISNINYMIPQLLIEQEKIAYLFSLINKDITLHQCKLEKLKLTKKALLQKLFPKNGKHIPEIRFKGFTDTWEQRKFGELFILKSGVAFKLSEYTKNGIPIINGESIKAGKISLEKVNYLPNEYQYKYQECLLFPGDIVLGLNRPIIDGELKISRIPSDIKTSLLYQRAGKIIFKVNMEENFTYQLLSKEVLTFTRREAVGSDQPFITTTKLNKWDLCLPVKDEERRMIGNLLDNINNIITLHQRKLERLQEVKKGLLQKMFV